MVPVSPAVNFRSTPSGFTVDSYAVPGPGYWTENSPPADTKRGFDSTASRNGGRPQFGGHTYAGITGVASTAAVTPAATVTPTPAPNDVSSRPWVVWRIGTAAYVPAGTAYPGRGSVFALPAAARRSAREVRDAARLATPQFGQNGMSGTTWSQCGHSTSPSGLGGSCASCSRAACSPIRTTSSAITAITTCSPKCSPCNTGEASSMPSAAKRTSVTTTLAAMGLGRESHSAAPTRPPVAAANSGSVAPWMPAC